MNASSCALLLVLLLYLCGEVGPILAGDGPSNLGTWKRKDQNLGFCNYAIGDYPDVSTLKM